MPVDPMTGASLPYEDESLDMMAMEQMMGPDAGADDMTPVDIQVPAFALPAVMELIAMLEQEMMGGSELMSAGPDPMMGPPMGGDMMGGGMPPMM